ncbi:MAG: fibronectin type III domain-containing protein [Flavobacteriales bacterium]|nr:fibronectin type III domain-containing protein [Flavobacteriales bacterium]
MKANIKLSLFQLTFVKLLALIRNVIAKMTGNPNFATPAVPILDLKALADAFEGAIEDATNGSRQSRLLRNQLALQVMDMLRTQADYVRSVCAGDAAKLESSGYDLAKQRAPIGIPGTAQDMQARMTNLQRQVELRWKRVYGAHGYQVWMTASDPAVAANWEAIGYTTRVRHLVTTLESYKAYWFCVSAIGTAGEGAQSDPAMGRAA